MELPKHKKNQQDFLVPKKPKGFSGKYDPKISEKKWQKYWEKEGIYKCKVCGEKFCEDCGEANEKLCIYCLDEEIYHDEGLAYSEFDGIKARFIEDDEYNN